MEISRNVVDPGGYPRPLSGATALKYRKPKNGSVELSGRSTGKRCARTDTWHAAVYEKQTELIDMYVSNKAVVTTTIRLRFDCDSTAVRLPFDRKFHRAIRPFDDLYHNRICLRVSSFCYRQMMNGYCS